jgi:hypothetical protein
MNDYSNYRPPAKDNLLWSADKIFRKQLDESGEDVIIDNVVTNAIIKQHSNPFNEDKEDRKFRCLHEIDIHRGSIVDYDGYKWIVVSEVDSYKVYKSAKIQKSNNILKLIKNEVLIEVPCIISKSLSWKVDRTKLVSLPDSQVLCTIPNNQDTQSVAVNQIYSLGNRNNFKIVAVDDITMVGLLILTMESTIEESHSIPEPQQPTEDITIVITGNATIQKGKTSTYAAQITQNGTNVGNKSVIFELVNVDGSSNIYASITSQNGNSVVISAGNITGKYVKLKATLSDDSSVVCEKTIQVVGLF